jgi:phytoene dehydrogenase-like protein
VIVGGGFAGVVAAWRLAEAGIDDFVLLELEDKAGGLARNGLIGTTTVPFGAAMLAPPREWPSPAVDRVLDLAGTDRALTYFPSVVFGDGGWRPSEDDAALALFGLGTATSRGARMLFADSREFADELDAMSVAECLASGPEDEKMKTLATRWCLARFGSRPAEVSASAFWHDVWRRVLKASSRPTGGPSFDARGRALVVPGGCAALLKPLLARIGSRFLPARVAILVKDGPAALVRAVNAIDASVTDYEAEAVILALPPFLVHRIAPALRERDRDLVLPQNTPWLVTAFQLSRWPAGYDPAIPVRQGADESAAVVLHAGAPPSAVLVVQRPFPASATDPSRMFLRDLDPDEARDWSFREVEKLFPDLRAITKRVELWRVGHGPIRPGPGYPSRIAPRLRLPLGRIHPCGADHAGIPSVESAIEDGVRAAEAVLQGFGRLRASFLK